MKDDGVAGFDQPYTSDKNPTKFSFGWWVDSESIDSVEGWGDLKQAHARTFRNRALRATKGKRAKEQRARESSLGHTLLENQS
jgi:hypothetical protein